MVTDKLLSHGGLSPTDVDIVGMRGGETYKACVASLHAALQGMLTCTVSGPLPRRELLSLTYCIAELLRLPYTGRFLLNRRHAKVAPH